MTYFFFNERTFIIHLVASGHRHKIVLSVNKLCMAHLAFYPGAFFLLNEFDIYKDTEF